MEKILETERLLLCEMTVDQAPFMLELLNSPGWLMYIGDRGVHTEEAAANHIENRIRKGYEKSGFGFYTVLLKDTNTPIGICGMMMRDGLEDVDIGFAFLPTYCGQGYAYEAAAATLQFAFTVKNLPRVVAIATKTNERSLHLLEKIGLQFEKYVTIPGDEEELALYGLNNNQFIP